MRRATFFLAAAASCAIPLLNAAPGDTGEPSADPAPEEVRVICRRERVTGTHFRRRVCRTPEQIEQDRQGVAEYMEEARRIEEAERRMRNRDW